MDLPFSAQRKHFRVAWRMSVEVVPDDGGDSVRASTLNISAGGMSLLTAKPLPKDAAVELRFELPDGVQRRRMQVRGSVLRSGVLPNRAPSAAVVFGEMDSRDRAFVRSCVLHQALRQMQSMAEYQAFRTVSDLDLLQLASVSNELVLAAGDYAAHHGDEATSVFLVKSGKVRLMGPGAAADEPPIEVVHAGQMFGEVSALLALPHSFDVIATEPTELLVVSRAALSYLREHNLHLALVLYDIIVAFMARRVRRLTARLAATAPF